MPIDKAQLYASVLTSFMSTTLASSASCMLVVASSVISIGSLLNNLGSSCIHPVRVVLSPDRVQPSRSNLFHTGKTSQRKVTEIKYIECPIDRASQPSPSPSWSIEPVLFQSICCKARAAPSDYHSKTVCPNRDIRWYWKAFGARCSIQLRDY